MEERGKPLPIETLPRKELEKIQNRRLRYTLRKAYETTQFYHELFDLLKIKPEEIKNKDDLNKSFEKGLKVTQEDIIINFDKLLPDYVKNKEITYTFLWTSGFGGRPKIIPYTYPFSHSNDVIYSTFTTMNVREKSKILSLLAPPPYSSGFLVTEALNTCFEKIIYQNIFLPIPTMQIISILQQLKPSHLFGSPTKLFNLGKEMMKMGVEPSSFNIKTILVGGESSTKERKNEIEKDWNAEVFDGIGTTECSFFAGECFQHNGMHVVETRVLFSVANLEKKEILDVGEEGFDLVTNLYEIGERPGIFLINYSHRDLTKILDETECECGRTFLRIDYPKRGDEIINLCGAKLYARDIEKVEGLLDYVNVLYSKKGQLEIRLLPKEGCDRQKLEERILEVLYANNPPAKAYIGDHIKIKILEKDKLYEGLQVPLGKPRKVIVVDE
jgi:phenylacetate-CoA ligase